LLKPKTSDLLRYAKDIWHSMYMAILSSDL